MSGFRVTGLNGVKSMLAALNGDMENVSKYSQNKLAYTIWNAEKDEMRADLDRPTPYSLGSIIYKKYNESALVVGGGDGFTIGTTIKGAGVFVMSRPRGKQAGEIDYLGVMILGGKTAGPKRSEVILEPWMPRDHVWVPSEWATKDHYGNIPGATFSAMLTALGLGQVNPVKKNWRLIGGREGQRGYRGVAKKVGRRWVPWIWFVPRQTYDRHWDFYIRADQEIDDHWESIYAFYLDKALEHHR